MEFLSFIYAYGLWIGPAVFVLSLVSLVLAIRWVIRVVKGAHLASVPLIEQQEVDFTDGGRVVLCTQGPRFSRRFARLGYDLIGMGGAPVSSSMILFPLRTSGVRWVRMTARYFHISMPGRYTLRVNGLAPGTEPDGVHTLVFMKPHLGASVAGVLRIVFSSLFLIGSLVLFLLRLTQE